MTLLLKPHFAAKSSSSLSPFTSLSRFTSLSTSFSLSFSLGKTRIGRRKEKEQRFSEEERKKGREIEGMTGERKIGGGGEREGERRKEGETESERQKGGIGEGDGGEGRVCVCGKRLGSGRWRRRPSASGKSETKKLSKVYFLCEKGEHIQVSNR